MIVGINKFMWETCDTQERAKQVFHVRGSLETSKVVMENLFGKNGWVKFRRIFMSLVGNGVSKILFL